MQRLGIIAVLDQFIGYLLRLHLRTAEDDGEDTGIVVHDALQGEVLVLRIDHIIDVVHVLRTLIARADDNFLMVVQISLGNTFHFAAHRSREHQRIVFSGQRLENLVDILREAHVQHFVGLVEHDVRHLLQVGIATVLQVNQSAWRSHDDLHPFPERPHLRLYRRTAVDGLHVNAIHVFREVAQVVGNLQTEFSRRREYQRLRIPTAGVKPHQQGDAEGGSLTRSRLGQGNHVVLVY